MSRSQTRYCGCGCGRRLEGRADQRYLNATHRKRGQRTKTELVSVTSVTDPYADTHTAQPVTHRSMEKSRLADFRGQIAVGAAEMALLLQAAELALSIRGLTSQAEREGLERIVARFPTRRRAAS